MDDRHTNTNKTTSGEGHIHSLRQRHGIQNGRALPNNYAVANESEEELSSLQERIQRLHEQHLHQTAPTRPR
eukprot:scaffold28559_cov72-Skeletonema_dohrnii-CCMP3373.AAC.2